MIKKYNNYFKINYLYKLKTKEGIIILIKNSEIEEELTKVIYYLIIENNRNLCGVYFYNNLVNKFEGITNHKINLKNIDEFVYKRKSTIIISSLKKHEDVFKKSIHDSIYYEKRNYLNELFFNYKNKKIYKKVSEKCLSCKAKLICKNLNNNENLPIKETFSLRNINYFQTFLFVLKDKEIRKSLIYKINNISIKFENNNKYFNEFILKNLLVDHSNFLFLFNKFKYKNPIFFIFFEDVYYQRVNKKTNYDSYILKKDKNFILETIDLTLIYFKTTYSNILLKKLFNKYRKNLDKVYFYKDINILMEEFKKYINKGKKINLIFEDEIDLENEIKRRVMNGQMKEINYKNLTILMYLLISITEKNNKEKEELFLKRYNLNDKKLYKLFKKNDKLSLLIKYLKSNKYLKFNKDEDRFIGYFINNGFSIYGTLSFLLLYSKIGKYPIKYTLNNINFYSFNDVCYERLNGYNFIVSKNIPYRFYDYYSKIEKNNINKFILNKVIDEGLENHILYKDIRIYSEMEAYDTSFSFLISILNNLL